MGADMLVQYLSLPVGTKPNWKAGYRVIKKHVAAWRRANDFPNNLEYLIVSASGSYTKDDYKNLEEHLTECLKELESGLGGRNWSSTHVGGYEVHITGGMSWGDSPSEEYDAISDLENACPEAFEACGFGSGTDYGKLVKKILKCKGALPLLIGLDDDLDVLIAKALKKR